MMDSGTSSAGRNDTSIGGVDDTPRTKIGTVRRFSDCDVSVFFERTGWMRSGNWRQAVSFIFDFDLDGTRREVTFRPLMCNRQWVIPALVEEHRCFAMGHSMR